jgi:20S proteasome alpha/beta subunit
MTLIVGIICKDGIVVASDSQTTAEDRTKSCRTKKISVVKLKHGSGGLVAEAGSTNSAEAVETMQQMAASKSLSHQRDFAEIAVGASAALKLKQKQAHIGSRKALAQYYSDYRFWLMTANYYRGKPYIYTMQSDIGALNSESKIGSYAALGNSPAIANYILGRFDFQRMELWQAAITAIYVVREVIEEDSTCGRPIMVGTVEYGGQTIRAFASRPFLWPNEWIDHALAELDRLDEKMKSAWAKQLNKVLLKVLKKEVLSRELLQPHLSLSVDSKFVFPPKPVKEV